MLKGLSTKLSLFLGCLNPCPAEQIKMPCPLLSQSDYLIPIIAINHILNGSADLDQLASSEANRSGSTLFAKAGYILVQKDKG